MHSVDLSSLIPIAVVNGGGDGEKSLTLTIMPGRNNRKLNAPENQKY